MEYLKGALVGLVLATLTAILAMGLHWLQYYAGEAAPAIAFFSIVVGGCSLVFGLSGKP